MCLPNILFPVFMFAFIFHCRSFSPCCPLAFLTAALNFHVFLPTKFVSITRSSSFFVIHVSVNIKNNAEKDTTLLLFFLSKSPGGHVISFQPDDWVILHWYACGVDGRSVYGHVITEFPRMGSLPHFLSYGAPSTCSAKRRVWNSAITFLGSCVCSLFCEPLQFTSGIPRKNASFLHTKQCPLWLHVSTFTHFNQPWTISNNATVTLAWHQKSSHRRDTTIAKYTLL